MLVYNRQVFTHIFFMYTTLLLGLNGPKRLKNSAGEWPKFFLNIFYFGTCEKFLLHLQFWHLMNLTQLDLIWLSPTLFDLIQHYLSLIYPNVTQRTLPPILTVSTILSRFVQFGYFDCFFIFNGFYYFDKFNCFHCFSDFDSFQPATSKFDVFR